MADEEKQEQTRPEKEREPKGLERDAFEIWIQKVCKNMAVVGNTAHNVMERFHLPGKIKVEGDVKGLYIEIKVDLSGPQLIRAFRKNQ